MSQKYPEDWNGKWRCPNCLFEQPRHPHTQRADMPVCGRSAGYRYNGQGNCTGRPEAVGGWKPEPEHA